MDRETKLSIVAALLVPTVVDEMRRNSDIGVASLDAEARREAVRQARLLEDEVRDQCMAHQRTRSTLRKEVPL